MPRLREFSTTRSEFMTPEAGLLVTVDPGRSAAGVSVFRGDRLVNCGFVRCSVGEGPAQWTAMAEAVYDRVLALVPGAARGSMVVDTLVVEQMETRKGRTDAHAALIELSQVSGAIWATIPWVRGFSLLPAWTGGRPKATNHRVIRKALTEEETAALERGLKGVPADNKKEVLDAVGIGLYVQRRML